MKAYKFHIENNELSITKDIFQTVILRCYGSLKPFTSLKRKHKLAYTPIQPFNFSFFTSFLFIISSTPYIHVILYPFNTLVTFSHNFAQVHFQVWDNTTVLVCYFCYTLVLCSAYTFLYGIKLLVLQSIGPNVKRFYFIMHVSNFILYNMNEMVESQMVDRNKKRQSCSSKFDETVEIGRAVRVVKSISHFAVCITVGNRLLDVFI